MTKKWKVLKDATGEPISAGYIDFDTVPDGYTVEEHAEVDKSVINQLRSRAPEPTECCTALYNIDVNTLDGDMKTVVMFLKEKFGL